jgi:hypothetical protein
VLEVDWLIGRNVFCTWGADNKNLIVSDEKEVVVAVGLHTTGDWATSARDMHCVP